MAANEDPDGNSTAVTVNLRFSGQYFDVETGFHPNYFRTLDPSTGRYLESDPIGLWGVEYVWVPVAQICCRAGWNDDSEGATAGLPG